MFKSLQIVLEENIFELLELLEPSSIYRELETKQV